MLVGPDEVLAVVPRELAGSVAARLSKYVLRAKAKVTDASTEWQFFGLTFAEGAEAQPAAMTSAAHGSEEAQLHQVERSHDALPRADETQRREDGGSCAISRGAGESQAGGELRARLHALRGQADDASLPAVVDAQGQHEASFVVRVGDSPARWLVATPLNASPLPAHAAGDAELGRSFAGPTEVNQREHWRALDIAAGLPQVYAATTEAFVAQMLNLDVLGAIAFDKGCYTGQEIIARAHYRGRIKRRMQRFRTLGPARLAIGDSGKLRDGRSIRIVEAVQLDDGRCEFLAVAAMGGGEEETPSPAQPDSAAATIHVEQLPLPYALPD
jgi:folate-binding protein YgfZ